MKGIYVASRSKHGPMWLKLRAAGVPIISTWIDECEVGATSSWPDLWTRCIEEAANAGALVLYVEKGEVLKGALVEVGAALSRCVKVFYAGPPRAFTFLEHPLVVRCPDLDTAVALAVKWGETHR